MRPEWADFVRWPDIVQRIGQAPAESGGFDHFQGLLGSDPNGRRKWWIRPLHWMIGALVVTPAPNQRCGPIASSVAAPVTESIWSIVPVAASNPLSTKP